MIESLPDPGPFEYAYRPQEYTPKYTMRLRLSSEMTPPPYPGPGKYFDASTIGNWGAGMAVHIREEPDIFSQQHTGVHTRKFVKKPKQLHVN